MSDAEISFRPVQEFTFKAMVVLLVQPNVLVPVTVNICEAFETLGVKTMELVFATPIQLNELAPTAVKVTLSFTHKLVRVEEAKTVGNGVTVSDDTADPTQPLPAMPHTMYEKVPLVVGVTVVNKLEYE